MGGVYALLPHRPIARFTCDAPVKGGEMSRFPGIRERERRSLPHTRRTDVTRPMGRSPPVGFGKKTIRVGHWSGSAQTRPQRWRRLTKECKSAERSE